MGQSQIWREEGEKYARNEKGVKWDDRDREVKEVIHLTRKRIEKNEEKSGRRTPNNRKTEEKKSKKKRKPQKCYTVIIY